MIDYDLVTGDTICSSCGFVLKTDNIQDVVEEGDGTLYRFSKSRPYQTTVYVREKLRSVHGSDPLIWYDHWKLIKGHILRVFGSDYGDALQNMGPKTFSRICREITVAREEERGKGESLFGEELCWTGRRGGRDEGGGDPCTLERGREKVPEVESSVHQRSLEFGLLLPHGQGEEVDAEHQSQILQEGPDEREREWYSLELRKESAAEESAKGPEEAYVEYTLPGPQDHLCLDVSQLHGQDRGTERPLGEQGFQPLARCKYGERWVQARRRLGLSTPEPMELSIVVDICRKTRVFELVHKEKFQFKLTNKNCLNLNYFILQIIRMNSEAAFHYWKRYIPLSSGKLEEYNPVWKEMILVLGKDYDRYFEEEENCFYELKWSYIPMYFCDLWLPKKERYH